MLSPTKSYGFTLQINQTQLFAKYKPAHNGATAKFGFLKDCRHEDVFSIGSESQDRLMKFVVPASGATGTFQQFDEMNADTYSLIQSEDSLFRTLGNCLF
jgi:hypothetical protein